MVKIGSSRVRAPRRVPHRVRKDVWIEPTGLELPLGARNREEKFQLKGLSDFNINKVRKDYSRSAH